MAHHHVSSRERKRQKEQDAVVAKAGPTGKPPGGGARKRKVAFQDPAPRQLYVAMKAARPRMLHTNDCFHAGAGNHVLATDEQLAMLPGCQHCA